MGEYAVRRSDGERVKIGTCEEMYYLRFEDRFAVEAVKGNVDPVRDAHELRFRLPFPDEDKVNIGEYADHTRGVRLYRKNDKPDFYDREGKGVFGYSDFENIPADDPGTLQLRHECGLLVNVTCHHGAKLPESTASDFTAFWNGKSWFTELASLRGVKTANGEVTVTPVVKCRFCRHQWRFDWATIWEYLTPEWQERFKQYAAESVIADDAGKASR